MTLYLYPALGEDLQCLRLSLIKDILCPCAALGDSSTLKISFTFTIATPDWLCCITLYEMVIYGKFM